jgi:hypothetical protein
MNEKLQGVCYEDHAAPRIGENRTVIVIAILMGRSCCAVAAGCSFVPREDAFSRP